MFDITATSNHWVVNPQHNLGLQLSVESIDGEFQTMSVNICLGYMVPVRRRLNHFSILSFEHDLMRIFFLYLLKM